MPNTKMERGKINVTIVEARDLKAADFNGKSDPYCIWRDTKGLIGEDIRTKVQKKTLNPVWNQAAMREFNYKLVQLKFDIYDHDMITSHDLLGKVTVPISFFSDGLPKDVWIPVKKKGNLHLVIQAHVPFKYTLPGTWVPINSSKCMVGLGWDFSKGVSIDLDASIILMNSANQPLSTVSFRSKTAFNGAVVHSGDNRTGEGSGDDEVIAVDFARLAAHPEVTKIAVIVNSFGGTPFTKVKSAYLRLIDAASNSTAAFTRLDKGFDSIGCFFGYMALFNGAWFFQAILKPVPGNMADQSLGQVQAILGSIGNPV